MSGSGTVSSVTLRQPASTGVSVTFEVEALNSVFIFGRVGAYK